jgi:hypothetical protein
MSTLTTSVQLIYSDWYPQSLITTQEFLVNLPQFTTKEVGEMGKYFKGFIFEQFVI